MRIDFSKEIEIVRRTQTEMKMELKSSVSYVEKGTRESCTSRRDLGDGRLPRVEDTVENVTITVKNIEN